MQFGKQEEEQVKVVLKPAVTWPVQEICSQASKPGTPEEEEEEEEVVWLYQIMLMYRLDL